MVVIDCDVVQMPHGGWEIEMNVTDWPAPKLLFSHGERWTHVTAGVRQLSPPLLTWLKSGTDFHVQHRYIKATWQNHVALSYIKCHIMSSAHMPFCLYGLTHYHPLILGKNIIAYKII